MTPQERSLQQRRASLLRTLAGMRANINNIKFECIRLDIIAPEGVHKLALEASFDLILEIDKTARDDWGWKPIGTPEEQSISATLRSKHTKVKK